MGGKFVKWNAVNGVISGLVIKPADHGVGNWVVALGDGKSVVVNENSFIYD